MVVCQQPLVRHDLQKLLSRAMQNVEMPTSIELCAGAGGQALGLERAGFNHVALVESNPTACATLRANRPLWNILEEDVRFFDGRPYRGTHLLAGGIPCPPFSIAGKQLGSRDERDLFPTVLRLVGEVNPRVVMIENVRGLLSRRFEGYRAEITSRLDRMGYKADWMLLQASDYGVPQLRPRVVMAALKKDLADSFKWPEPSDAPPLTVGDVLFDLIQCEGWEGAQHWRTLANGIAPTVVGGSHKHGGPDLGPVRARQAWASLGVDGMGVANTAPSFSYKGVPRLTVRMVARLQGFPDEWEFVGGKTAAYKQVGNAFPPPVAEAVGREIMATLGCSQPVLAEA